MNFLLPAHTTAESGNLGSAMYHIPLKQYGSCSCMTVSYNKNTDHTILAFYDLKIFFLPKYKTCGKVDFLSDFPAKGWS